MANPKKGVLLLAFGGADSLESIGPFVKNVLKGRPVTEELIEKTKERYKLIGGKSPLLDITNEQAGLIENILRKNGDNRKVYVGMRYWHPFIKDTLSVMKDDGIDSATAVIMAPFASRVSTGGYQKDVEEALSTLGTPKIEFVSDWHTHPLFIEILAERLKAELSSFSKKEDVLVIFSNHSLPKAALEGDPYESKIRETVSEVVKKVPVDYRIAYQSQGSGPREWLGPKPEEVMEEAKRAGKKGVVVMPLGFVADHVETLYDIDIVFKEAAGELGLVFKRSSSLNTTPKFMELIAKVIERHG